MGRRDLTLARFCAAIIVLVICDSPWSDGEALLCGDLLCVVTFSGQLLVLDSKLMPLLTSGQCHTDALPCLGTTSLTPGCA